jgi:hypothetical protein
MMMQEIVVGLIVFCAALVVLKRYAPKGLKRAARIGTVRLAKALGWQSLADKLSLQAEAGASCGDGCGSCGSCGTTPTTTPTTGPSVTTVSVEKLKETLRR